MRILVLSLLRLGDLLMQKPLLEGLRRRYPTARLDIVINPGSLAAKDAIDGVDEWIVFERDRLQADVGTAEIPLFAPVRDVSSFIDDLSARRYGAIFNFTHNRLSAHLAAGISAETKFGLVAEGRGFRPLEGRWVRHFNERFGWKGATLFHYTELLAGIFGLEVSPLESFAQGKRILLQPLTSDKKKNWSLQNWEKVLQVLRSEGHDVQILGAPFEKEILTKHFEIDDLTIADLRGVRNLLRQSALVITGDTSIKHLAALEGVPTLEIALGSAEPRSTGAFQKNAMILQSHVSCAPCPISSTCRKLSHECGEDVALEDVVNAMKARSSSTETIAGEWVIRSTEDHTTFIDAFEKHLWRVFLNQEATEASSIGSQFLSRAFQSGFHPADALETLEREQSTLQHLQQSTLSTLKASALQCMAGSFDPATLQGLRHHLTTLTPANRRLRTHTQELSEAAQRPFTHPLAFFGHVRRATEEFGERLEIRQRWLTLIREMGGSYERLARDLSEHGPETP